MTRKSLATLVAAVLSLPAVAMAMPNNAGNPTAVNLQSSPAAPRDRVDRVAPRQDTGTLGNGINSRSNGDVTGPGQGARIDPSTKGPLNDVQPGTPSSDDVPQSKNPQPVR